MIDDLLSPLRAAGVTTTLEVDDALAAGTANDELLHRAAREALRNAEEHAAPSRVAVRVAPALTSTGCTSRTSDAPAVPSGRTSSSSQSAASPNPDSPSTGPPAASEARAARLGR